MKPWKSARTAFLDALTSSPDVIGVFIDVMRMFMGTVRVFIGAVTVFRDVGNEATDARKTVNAQRNERKALVPSVIDVGKTSLDALEAPFDVAP